MNEKKAKASNLLRIYNRLKQSPSTLDSLYNWAKRIGMDISRRSLYRYLNQIEAEFVFAGERLVVYEGDKNRKIWKIEYDSSTDVLSQEELNKWNILRSLGPATIPSINEKFFDKIERYVYQNTSSSKYQLNGSEIERIFQGTNILQQTITGGRQKIIDELILAIQNRRVIEAMVYDSEAANRKYRCDLLPVKIFFHVNSLHLCCLTEELDDVSFIPIANIIEVETTQAVFRKVDIDTLISSYLKNHFGLERNYFLETFHIQLEFIGYPIGLLDSFQVHSTQELSALTNGNTLLQIHCGINRELINFISSYNGRIRVRGPQVLQRILSRLQSPFVKWHDPAPAEVEH